MVFERGRNLFICHNCIRIPEIFVHSNFVCCVVVNISLILNLILKIDDYNLMIIIRSNFDGKILLKVVKSKFQFFFFRVLKYNFTWDYYFFFLAGRMIHRNLTGIKIFLYLLKRIGRKANEILTIDFAPLNFAEINCIVYI